MREWLRGRWARKNDSKIAAIEADIRDLKEELARLESLLTEEYSADMPVDQRIARKRLRESSIVDSLDFRAKMDMMP